MNAEPRCFVVVPTYHRDDRLRVTLSNILSQTNPPRLEIIVVDNAGQQSCEEICNVFAHNDEASLRYVNAESNLGAAGGTALGMEIVLQEADDSDWIVRCDDDSPNLSKDLLGVLALKAQRLRASDPSVAGLGTSGSLFDYRRCRLLKPLNSSSAEIIDVDYLATNMYPFFSVGAVRNVGTFRKDLFFGHDEVEFGLRLRRHGYRLCRIDVPNQERRPSTTSWRLGSPGWRRYYALRNIVVIAREYCGPFTALRVSVIRGLLKPLLNLFVEPGNAIRHLRLNARAVMDAYLGRMGRTLEPRLIAGELDLRQKRVD